MRLNSFLNKKANEVHMGIKKKKPEMNCYDYGIT